jgi:hypothetical protein
MFNTDGDVNNNQGNDTITGWEWAGILSPGDSGHHVDVCHFNEHMFTFNYRGELFKCIYPNLSWSKMSIPGDDKVYAFFCDTINGLLYITTRQNLCNVYEYEIQSNQWHCLTPEPNVWFDSTKLLNGEMCVHIYDITVYKNKVFMMTIQGWNNIGGQTEYIPVIWCSERNALWVKADSGWVTEKYKSHTVTAFRSIDDYLYATTWEKGLWRYDGVSWMIVPGTTPEEVHDSSVNGGDTKAIPGFRPRSIVKHKNEIYVGNLGGFVHKLLPGDTWDRWGLFYLDYNANKILETRGPCMSLYSYNGYLIKQTYYYNDSADLWYNMTPNFNHIDTMYINGLPGTVYGMTNIGDTLFAALGNNDGKHSGVYFLDLKTRKWYDKYH